MSNYCNQVIPEKLPFCNYPKASEISEHGLFSLPDKLPAFNLENALKYRSCDFKAVACTELSADQLLQTAKLVAKSFASNEPMNKHVHPPILKPELVSKPYCDHFGESEFGLWTTENIVYWFIRINILTQSHNPGSMNKDFVNLSITISDENKSPIGVAYNGILMTTEEEEKHPNHFGEAVNRYMFPILKFIHEQEIESINALGRKYHDFEKALKEKQVAMHFMIARSDKLPTKDTFELIAYSAQHLHSKGFRYMVVTASNQWTGAACEVLNGTRVHFLPFRNFKRLSCQIPSETEPYSSDGYISAKDSGAIFYVIKLINE